MNRLIGLYNNKFGNLIKFRYDLMEQSRQNIHPKKFLMQCVPRNRTGIIFLDIFIHDIKK
jgi:hypothetical protein